MLNHFTSRLCAIAAPFFLSLSLSASAAGNAIVIGQAVDLSGPNASIGRDYVAGIKTYFDIVNSTGGVNGRRIQYLTRDDRGQPQLSANLASDLIDREQVDYLMGGIGDDTTTAVLNAPSFKRSGHTLFAPLAAADYPSDSRVLFWRPSYKQEVRHILSHFGKIGSTDVGIVVQASPVSEQTYHSLAAAAQDLGITVKGLAKIGEQGDRIAEEAARMAARKPGFILIAADTISTAEFLKVYRRHDAQTFVAGTSLTNFSTLYELAGERAMAWTVFAQVVPNPTSGTTLLQMEHLNGMKKYRDEAVSSLTLEGFAAAKALVAAIQQSKRVGRLSSEDFMVRNRMIDLGGFSVGLSNGSNRLSGYVDIALFQKGSRLMF